MNIRGTFTITGDVQGVRYRETVRKMAAARGLLGFVRNRRDGSVKVVAEGDERVVRAFRRALAIRSSRLRVEKVQSRYSAPRGRFTRFRIFRGKGISDGELEILERLDMGLVIMERSDRKHDETNRSIRSVDRHITGMDRHITGMDRHITGMDRHITGMDRHITGMDRHITGMDQNIGRRFDRLDRSYGSFGRTLKTVSRDMKGMRRSVESSGSASRAMAADVRSLRNAAAPRPRRKTRVPATA